ncbi:MAG TPA: HAMP domain-containing sensor histidine kinase [Thermoleophilaceae bacterium]|nr:HAMP domain-containing sensor histidine kinase [Thermoleophilaceae bacterium]
MSRFGRSLGTKLALLFTGITAVAFAAVFFIVVPQLQNTLEKERLTELQRVAPAFAPQIEGGMNKEIKPPKIDELIRSVADNADAEVTIFGIQRQANRPPLFYTISNSNVSKQVDASKELAGLAFKRHRQASGVVDMFGSRYAQVAIPLPTHRPNWIVVYAHNLSDVHGTVGVIRNRILLAGGVALIITLIGGYLVARRLARRVKRLEVAVTGVAEGNFHEPLPVTSEDELGQLTRSFNEMQAQLARLDTARSQFIANASHELRTPIFSIGGFVELLRDEDIDEETRKEFIWLMGEQIERLQKLAVSLLDLSRIDAGSLELNPEEVDLSELVREVAGEFTPAVGRHETELDLVLPEEVEAICDRERVAQIVRILLDNALRHTPRGTRVEVAAGRENGTAQLTVSDRGPGVSAVISDRVFERFYTGDAVRGSGLGLAIARELADRMSGTIELDSKPGETAFTLALPAADHENGSA